MFIKKVKPYRDNNATDNGDIEKKSRIPGGIFSPSGS